MKKLIDRFWLPTPKKMRKLGYSILGACTLLAGGGLVAMDEMQEIFSPTEMKWIIGVTIVLGFLAKVTTSFFTEEADENSKGV